MMDFNSLPRTAAAAACCLCHIIYHTYTLVYVYLCVCVCTDIPSWFWPGIDDAGNEVRLVVVPGLLCALCNLWPWGKTDWPQAIHVNKITFTILYAIYKYIHTSVGVRLCVCVLPWGIRLFHIQLCLSCCLCLSLGQATDSYNINITRFYG